MPLSLPRSRFGRGTVRAMGVLSPSVQHSRPRSLQRCKAGEALWMNDVDSDVEGALCTSVQAR